MILVFQHSDVGTPGRLGATLRDHGLDLEFCRPDQPVSRTNRAIPPDFDGVRGIVILGGPQNVTDIDKHEWMRREAEYVKAAHALDLPIVGICLGAQLIAQALGGVVAYRQTPGLGMETLRLNPAGQTETIFSGIQWNGPQFFSCEQEVQKAPPGAMVLASTASTPVAAFKVGVRTYAFQFHPECDEGMLRVLAERSASLGAKAGISVDTVLKQIHERYQAYARLSDRLCVNIAGFCFPLSRRKTA